MKPTIHADSSVKKYGGVRNDYLPIHDLMDSSKSGHASVKHRCIFHSAFGVYIVEKIFGHNIINSENKEVSVRDIAEDHIIEDLGVIPSLDDYLKCMSIEPWMGGIGGKDKVVVDNWRKLLSEQTITTTPQKEIVYTPLPNRLDVLD